MRTEQRFYGFSLKVDDIEQYVPTEDDIPLDVWAVNDETTLLFLNPYISSVSSDNLIAQDVLCEFKLT